MMGIFHRRVKAGDKCKTLVKLWSRDCEGVGVEESGHVRRQCRTIKNCPVSHPDSSAHKLCDLKKVHFSVFPFPHI